MTRSEMFWMLLVTVVMVLNGARARKDNPALAILMIVIPLSSLKNPVGKRVIATNIIAK